MSLYLCVVGVFLPGQSLISKHCNSHYQILKMSHFTGRVKISTHACTSKQYSWHHWDHNSQLSDSCFWIFGFRILQLKNLKGKVPVS